jgi:hypothetical protein
LRDYFRNAHFQFEHHSVDITLPYSKIKFIQSTDCFPNSKKFIKKINNEYKWNDETLFIKNASDGPWDSWKSYSNNLVIIYQKRTEGLDTKRDPIIFNDFLEEKKKIDKLIKEIKLKNDDTKEKIRFIACIITSSSISKECRENILKSEYRIAVISKDCFSDYYGDAFSFKYCKNFNLFKVPNNILINELDLNELNKFPLNNLQDEIINQRKNTPFRDWNHLLNLIPSYPIDLKDFTFF